jgi:hypothetical protein
MGDDDQIKIDRVDLEHLIRWYEDTHTTGARCLNHVWNLLKLPQCEWVVTAHDLRCALPVGHHDWKPPEPGSHAVSMFAGADENGDEWMPCGECGKKSPDHRGDAHQISPALWHER